MWQDKTRQDDNQDTCVTTCIHVNMHEQTKKLQIKTRTAEAEKGKNKRRHKKRR
jgi:hypothetical protein